MIRKTLVLCLLLMGCGAWAQQSSTFGWRLSNTDTLRVLMVFVEVEYDTEPELEVLPEGSKHWNPGELPNYADKVFDVFPSSKPEGLMTRYYNESSLGNFLVLGDYLPKLYRIKWSEISSKNIFGLLQSLTDQFRNEELPLVSNAGLFMKDFDFWKKASQEGAQREKSGEEFLGVDHLMIFTRNFHKLPKDNGQASGSSTVVLEGIRADTYSIFAGGYGLPFSILRHEFNHLLIGGNNFHCCGGNGPGFTSYFPFVQGGWGMMGGANSSFQSCSGWDRYWLGWKHPDNSFEISARDPQGYEVQSDINRESGGGTFLLRDFVTTGDALRIELPFIPDKEYKQWLWIENHTTQTYNDSEFDVFQYEMFDCITSSEPGLYMHMQVDADDREGTGIFSKVKADYLRPVLADGNFDFQWEDEPLKLGYCVNSKAYIPYFVSSEFENPLTGNHAQEFPQVYSDKTEQLDRKTARVPHTRRQDGVYERIALSGHPRNGFRTGENVKLGIGTNPSSANMLTLTNNRRPTRGSTYDNRSIYLNGLRVEIIETFTDKSVLVKVDFDDNEINEDRRWCAPQIILNNHIPTGPDLVVKAHLKLDIGQTITRFDNPIQHNEKKYFTDFTTMKIHADAEMEVQGRLTLTGNSKLVVQPTGLLTVQKGARVFIEDGSEIRIERIEDVRGKGKIKIRKGGSVVLPPQVRIKDLKAKIKPRKRIVQ